MKDKKNFVILGAILAVVATLLFFVVGITPDFIIAYCFFLAGVIWMTVSGVVMVSRKGEYPWIGAVPATAGTYLVVQAVISIVVVLLEQLMVWSMPAGWFILLHTVLAAVFVVRMLFIKGGAEHIRGAEEKLEGETRNMRELQAKLEALKINIEGEEAKKAADSLSEAVRFSDPVGTEETEELEKELLSRADALINGKVSGVQIAAEMADMEKQLRERNNICKRTKG